MPSAIFYLPTLRFLKGFLNTSFGHILSLLCPWHTNILNDSKKKEHKKKENHPNWAMSIHQVFSCSPVRSSGPAKHCFVEIGHEIISAAILSLPLIQAVQLSVRSTGEGHAPITG